MELDPAYVVTGKVIVKGSGKPCVSGNVTITDPKQNEYSHGEIERDGSVRMASVIPGRYQVKVACDGHISGDKYPMIEVTDRNPSPQAWEVERGGVVRIELVDAGGRPVLEASLNATSSDERGEGGYTDRSEADGSFVVSGLKPGGYRVEARAADGATAEKEVTIDSTREERLRLLLPKVGVIEGFVEDDDHKPVPDALVIAGLIDGDR